MPPKSKKPAPAPALDDIDLSAALPPGPPPPEPKKGRGRPRSTAPKPPRKYKVRKDKGTKRKPQPPDPSQFPYIDNNNILVSNDIIERDNINKSDDIGRGELSAASDLKGKMTVKELKFLEIYFAGGKTLEDAMITAGYTEYQKSSLNTMARRIVQKHESQVGDHRILARAMGAGEVKVLNSLISLMNSKSELIKLNATAQLAKILGMTKEQVEGAGGITIIFEQPDAPGQPAARTLPSQDAEEPKPVTYQQPVRVLQITK